MKCPKCNREVEKGSLYCPYCLAEIPWVREFNSVETLMKKEQQRSPEKRMKRKIYRKWSVAGMKQIFLFVTAAALILGIFCYRQLHTFSALYAYAQRQYGKENYSASKDAVNAALEKKPGNEAANILLSEIMEKEGDLKSAILILRPLVNNETAGVEVYKALIRMLIEDGQSQEANTLLKGCSQKIKRACGEYISGLPEASLASGLYTATQTLELTADDGQIYYTLDGTVPTEQSQKYTGPIALKAGTTELKAICINEYGVASEVLSEKYVINLNTPNAPEVSPKSGDYGKKTKIKVKVPEGCTAYYAFDSEPDTHSTVYERPISMPEGYHIFNVILVTDGGKVSKITSKEYYLQY